TGLALHTTVDYPDRSVTTGSRFYFSESKAAGVFSGLSSSPTIPSVANTDGVYIADLGNYLAARQYFDPDCSPFNNCTVSFQIVSTGLLESYFEIAANTAKEYRLFLVNQIDYEVLCELQAWTSSTYTFNMQIVGIDDTGLQTTNSISLYMALTDHNEYDPVIDATHVFSLNENSAFGTNVGSQMVCQSLYECYADTIEYEPLLTT
ncbi:uncharacterized protein LOC142355839, partial [Convolutriloba macropyga]|uniref:uncharacterized protein LOC142355839 n=1 Tax=Convolutriloba macropyga TaxID=536237 RepID=UPI003F51AEED